MKKILIVEDEEILQKLYFNTLTMAKYDVTVVKNGNLALEKLKDQNWDLIILDVMLPGGMNGFDVLERIKKDPRTTKIPVIMATNLNSEKDTALKIGAVDYLIKSDMSVTELVIKIQKILQTIE
jgi:DNA-binding response OmpR family regulator